MCSNVLNYVLHEHIFTGQGDLLSWRRRHDIAALGQRRIRAYTVGSPSLYEDDAGHILEPHSAPSGCLKGPKGREGLFIERWVCCQCGAEHERDAYAAINLRRLGTAGAEFNVRGHRATIGMRKRIGKRGG
jgi:hypothetical protein